MSERRKRLIEVAFPLEEVSAHSRREKNVRHGHISNLHIWWARRPLAACRAFIYASLVDDPETDTEREALLREVADLASWDAVRHPDRVVRAAKEGGSGLTGTQLLKRARRRILDCNGGEPPRLLDPFAGGGAIPSRGYALVVRLRPEISIPSPSSSLKAHSTTHRGSVGGTADRSRTTSAKPTRRATSLASRVAGWQTTMAVTPSRLTCATGVVGCWSVPARSWPDSTRRIRMAACLWRISGAAPSLVQAATRRCP